MDTMIYIYGYLFFDCVLCNDNKIIDFSLERDQHGVIPIAELV